MGASGTKTATKASMELVQSTISSHKVVVFSKTYCPYCTKAKSSLQRYLKPSQYFVMELESRDDCNDLQGALAEMTGGSSVPRVFVGGKFIGGGDDTARLAGSGELKTMLEQAGAL